MRLPLLLFTLHFGTLEHSKEAKEIKVGPVQVTVEKTGDTRHEIGPRSDADVDGG